MDNPGDFFLQLYAVEAKKQHRSRLFIRALFVFFLVMLSLGAVWFEPTFIQALTGLFTAMTVQFYVFFRTKRKTLERHETLFALLEVDPEVFDNPSRMKIAFEAAQSGTFQSLQVSKTQRRMRGSDEKGFTSGKTVSPLDSARKRRDASLSDPMYVGLEDDLRPSELLVSQANERYEQRAQERWDAAESADQDLIEAGVERLGDLVRTDWFEKNAKEGAVQSLMEAGDDSEPV